MGELFHHGTTKAHKLKEEEGLEDLTLRPTPRIN